MKTTLLTIFSIFLTSFVFSQTYETKNKVYIPKGLVIQKTETSKNCEEKITKNSIIKSEQTKTKDGKNYTITKLATLSKDSLLKFDKKQTLKITDFSGWVNIKEDEKDKSKLNINPWLSREQKIDSSTIIKRINKSIDCAGNYISIVKMDTLKKDEVYRYSRVEKKDTISIKSDWFSKSKNIIEIYNSNAKIEYYLINKFDQNADYYLKLNNRSFVSLKKQSVVFGPVTIPFKYRFSHAKNEVNIESEFSADFNAGIFVGKNWGRYRVRYESKELKKLSNLSLTVGPFLSLSTTNLDSESSSGAKSPLREDESKTIASISPGIGIMTSIYNFNFGFFGGFDLGFGNSAKKWNFNNRPWIGFGIGYNITSSFLK
jgi:hypothetical protein